MPKEPGCVEQFCLVMGSVAAFFNGKAQILSYATFQQRNNISLYHNIIVLGMPGCGRSLVGVLGTSVKLSRKQLFRDTEEKWSFVWKEKMSEICSVSPPWAALCPGRVGCLSATFRHFQQLSVSLFLPTPYLQNLDTKCKRIHIFWVRFQTSVDLFRPEGKNLLCV